MLLPKRKDHWSTTHDVITERVLEANMLAQQGCGQFASTWLFATPSSLKLLAPTAASDTSETGVLDSIQTNMESTTKTLLPGARGKFDTALG